MFFLLLTRAETTETRSVTYTYRSAEELTETLKLKNAVIDYRTPYLLETVTDPLGNQTKYEYQEGPAVFTYDKDRAHNKNIFILLNAIIDKYSPDGKFKNKRCFEYDVPAKGLYKKWFYNGYMEYYKLNRQYMINLFGVLKRGKVDMNSA